jgi:hypothetical protein
LGIKPETKSVDTPRPKYDRTNRYLKTEKTPEKEEEKPTFKSLRLTRKVITFTLTSKSKESPKKPKYDKESRKIAKDELTKKDETKGIPEFKNLRTTRKVVNIEYKHKVIEKIIKPVRKVINLELIKTKPSSVDRKIQTTEMEKEKSPIKGIIKKTLKTESPIKEETPRIRFTEPEDKKEEDKEFERRKKKKSNF